MQLEQNYVLFLLKIGESLYYDNLLISGFLRFLPHGCLEVFEVSPVFHLTSAVYVFSNFIKLGCE